MGKRLAIPAILGAAVAAELTIDGGPIVPVVAVLITLAASVLLLLDRRVKAVAFAVVLVVLGIVAIPQAFASFVVKGTDLNFLHAYGPPFVAALGLLVALACVVVEWDGFDASWKAPVATGLLLLTMVWFFLVPTSRFANLGSFAATLPPLFLALACIVAGVWLWPIPEGRARST